QQRHKTRHTVHTVYTVYACRCTPFPAGRPPLARLRIGRADRRQGRRSATMRSTPHCPDSPMPKNPAPETPDVALSKRDSALLNILVKDGRASFADIARQLGISRAHARARVQALQSNGVIELFGAVINPEKLGKVISTFVDIKGAPAAMEMISQEMAVCKEVVIRYI